MKLHYNMIKEAIALAIQLLFAWAYGTVYGV